MIFTSQIFLFLFVPIFFTLYFLLPHKWKNLLILFGSIFFYSWGEPVFVWIVLLSSFFDWVFSKMIFNSEREGIRKLCLGISVFLNIGLLFYFKYFNFFIDNINCFLKIFNFKPLGSLEIFLPLAISFITFEKITYIVDCYKKIGKPANNLLDYFTYVLIFPKLIAGPIIKYHDIEGQIKERTTKFEDVKYGFYRFIKGLFKKVFIADTMAEVVDYVFALAPAQLGFIDAWIGALFFTLQIYFDFSGYSDMAIGLLRIMGFKIMENFNLPYISKTFSEFWRRWHISLSTFIKEYLYIPLGGNRCSQPRQYLNLILCFLLSGLWHGASWIFVLWGLYHGVFLILDKAQGLKVNKERHLPAAFQILATFFLVVISWVIFRSQNLAQLCSFLKSMFSFEMSIFTSKWLMTKNVIFFFVMGFMISFIPAIKFYQTKAESFFTKHSNLRFVGYILLLILVIGKISVKNCETFIYFRF